MASKQGANLGKNKQSAKAGVLPISCRVYQQSLHAYWNGSQSGALDLISQALASDTGPEEVSALYRLWIEILTEQNDVTSLRELSTHLIFMARYAGRQAASFYGLAGIADFEQGNIEAVQLTLSSISRFKNNVYVAELQQKMHWRLSCQQPLKIFQTFLCKKSDYIQTAFLAQLLWFEKRLGQLRGVLNFSKKRFPGSPLATWFDIHRLYDKNELQKSTVLAKKLVARFPQNPEFQSTLGWLLLESRQFSQVLAVVESSSRFKTHVSGQFLQAEALFHIARENRNPQDFDAAHKAVTKTNLILTRAGISSSYMRKMAIEIDNYLETNPDIKPENAWLIHCESLYAAYLSMANSKSVDEVAQSFGQKVRKGDLCFFVSDGFDKTSCRMFAIYIAQSDPFCHMLYVHQNYLKSLVRLDKSIPLDLVHTSSWEKNEDGFAIYRMDNHALDSVLHAIEEYSDIGDVGILRECLQRIS